LDLASCRCPCSWHARRPGVFGQKFVLKLDHPPYWPDLAPCDFWLFPKLKTALKGHRFSDIPEEEFQKCFEQWKHRLTKCIGAQGDHFECDCNHWCVKHLNTAFTGTSLNYHTSYVNMSTLDVIVFCTQVIKGRYFS
jgi:hypothetical protein